VGEGVRKADYEFGICWAPIEREVVIGLVPFAASVKRAVKTIAQISGKHRRLDGSHSIGDIPTQGQAGLECSLTAELVTQKPTG